MTKKRRRFVKINRRIILTKRRFAKIKRRFISVKRRLFCSTFLSPYSAKAKAADKLMPAAFFLCLIAEHIFHFLEEALLFTRRFGLKLFVFVQFVQ